MSPRPSCREVARRKDPRSQLGAPATLSITLDSPLRFVPGVGPRRAELLAAKGLHVVEDLLYHLPHRYEDRGDLIFVHAIIVLFTFRARGQGTNRPSICRERET